MDIQVRRIFKGPKYTISNIFINGEYFCDGIEDVDRGLTQDMSDAEIKARKIYGQTAIPTGKYEVSMSSISPRFSKIRYYKAICGGYMPKILNVPGYEGVLIHPGNTAEDTLGCLIVGKNKVRGKVVDSKKTWEILMKKYLLPCKERGETINIEYL